MGEANNKGDIAESIFQLEALKRKYLICKSVLQDCPYDFVLDRNNNLERVQVKFRSLNSIGCIKIKLRQSISNNNKDYTLDTVDYFAVYIPEIDKLAYVPISDFADKSEIVLRTTPTRNNQVIGVTMIDKYLEW